MKTYVTSLAADLSFKDWTQGGKWESDLLALTIDRSSPLLPPMGTEQFSDASFWWLPAAHPLSKWTGVKWEWRTGNVDLTHFPVGGAEAEGEKINSQHMWEMLWEQVWATYIIYQWDVSIGWDKGWDFSIWGICVCHLHLPCVDGMSEVSDTGASISISLIFSPHSSKVRCKAVGGFLIIAWRSRA